MKHILWLSNINLMTSIHTLHTYTQYNSEESRTQRIYGLELRIGTIPQQEVRQPLLSRGAHEQVRVGYTVCSQLRVPGEEGLVDGAGRELSAGHLGGQGAATLHNVAAPTVADRQT